MNLDTSLRQKTADEEFSGERTISLENRSTTTSESSRLVSTDELRKKLHEPENHSIGGSFFDLHAIGMGGMGTVYSAYEPVLDREVALKVLRPKYREHAAQIDNFIREAVVTAEINHPNIVPVYRMGVFDDAGVFFTMKRLSGETLRKVIRKVGERRGNYAHRYTMRCRMDIFVSICNGIAYAHSKGIIHRDLKPANIMVGEYGEVTIMDWGLARNVHRDFMAEKALPNTTPSGRISGTPSFMAPEQALGQDDLIDERSDVYGLGAVLYTLLTLTTAPFNPEMETEQLLKEVIAGNLIPPRRRAPKENIPRELESICLKAMSREREKRYESAATLLDDVRNYLENYPVAAYRPGIMYRFVKLCKRRPLIPATVVGAMAMAGAFFAVTYLEEHSKTTSFLQLGDNSMRNGDVYYRLAMRGLTDASRQSDEQREELNRYIAEMDSAYLAALDAYQQAEGIGLKRSQVSGKIANLLRSRLAILVTAKKYDEVRLFDRNMRRRWKKEMQMLALSSPELMRKVRQIVLHEGELALTSVPGGVPFKIESTQKVVLDKTQAGAWKTPFRGKLPEGRYRLTLYPQDGHPIRMPLTIAPGEVTKESIHIPEFFPEGTIYIPEGRFISMLDHGKMLIPQGSANSLPGFFIGRHEVTFREYIEFWKSLKNKDDRERHRGKYLFDRSSRIRENLWDNQGHLRKPFTLDLPVVGIPGAAAEAYCRYLGEKYKVNCRLPSPLEWEKAARGTDGRKYVWGSKYIENAALNLEQNELTKYPAGAPPGTFSRDRSPYGAWDMAGNVREFVQPIQPVSKLNPVMGGSYDMSRAFSVIGYSGYARDGENDIGFRYVIEDKNK